MLTRNLQLFYDAYLEPSEEQKRFNLHFQTCDETSKMEHRRGRLH
jgi:hypothetical protein